MFRLWRFLFKRTELVLLILKVLFAEADRLAILLLFMSPTVPDIAKLELVSRNQNVVDKGLTEQGYQSERKPCCRANKHKAVPEYGYAHASSSALIS